MGTENLMKFGLWFLRYASGQTDTLIAILFTPTGGKNNEPELSQWHVMMITL